MSSADTPTPAASGTEPAATASTSSTSVDYDNTLVQYLVVRSDLLKAPHKWSVGALISNACHAAVAAVADGLLSHDDATLRYVKEADGQQMHKVTLQCAEQQTLTTTSEKLHQHQIQHRLWVEQPENMPVCLATKPYPRHLLKPLFAHLKLFR